MSSYVVNAAVWLPTANGIQVPSIVYKDATGSLAIPQTPFVISAGGVLIPAPVDANNIPQVSTGNAVSAILQTAAAATGAGNNIDVSGMATAVFKVSGTFVGIVTFEVTTDETDPNGWTAVQVTQTGAGTISTTASASGNYRADVAGFKMARARISAYTSGAISVAARVTPLEAPNKSINASITGSLANVTGHLATVTTSGTRVQLPNIPCREVTITALRLNIGYIYAGGSDVSTTVYGVELGAKDSFTFAVANTNQIYIDSSVNGGGISYVAI